MDVVKEKQCLCAPIALMQNGVCPVDLVVECEHRFADDSSKTGGAEREMDELLCDEWNDIDR